MCLPSARRVLATCVMPTWAAGSSPTEHTASPAGSGSTTGLGSPGEIRLFYGWLSQVDTLVIKPRAEVGALCPQPHDLTITLLYSGLTEAQSRRPGSRSPTGTEVGLGL